MKNLSKRLTFVALLSAAALALAACSGSPSNTGSSSGKTAAPSRLTPVTFVLDFIPSGQYGAFYLAKEKGFYKDAGLNVTIAPGTGTAQTITTLAGGKAQLGFTDVISLMQAQDTANPPVMLSEFYQDAPYVVLSLDPGANIASMKDLEGKTVASNAGSFTPSLIKALMNTKGLNSSSVHFTNVDPSSKGSLLAAGKVPAIETFATSAAALAGKVPNGKKLVSMSLASQGLTLYSNGIVADKDYISAHPDVVKAFIKASLQGMQAAMKDPEAAAKAVTSNVSGLDLDESIREMKIVNSIEDTASTREHGLGYIDPDLMKKSYDFAVKGLALKNPPKLSDIYDTSFLPDPAITAHAGN